MAGVQEIYNELFAGKTLTIACTDANEFHTLRTALCKKNQINAALELTDGSIVAQYDSDKQVGMFKLAPSQRKQAASRWQIIDSQEESE